MPLTESQIRKLYAVQVLGFILTLAGFATIVALLVNKVGNNYDWVFYVAPTTTVLGVAMILIARRRLPKHLRY